jgi:hypothetical protein
MIDVLWLLPLIAGIVILATICVVLARLNKDLWNLVDDLD